MRTLRLLFLGIIFLSFSLNAQQEKLTQRLINELDNVTENDYVKVIFFLQDQVDITSMDKEFYARRASIEERTYTVITTLQELAERTQKDFRQYLSAKELEDKVFTFTPFWITNMIAAEVKPEVVYEAASRSDVMYIDQDALLEWDRPVYREADNRTKNIESVETGIKVINAHLLWEMGITGQGRIVMGIDTGVDVNHPALSYKWRGNHVPADQAWFDPNTGSPTPTDCDDHGTHTMGTMTGRNDATGDTVGVAINAEWIAAKTICSSPHTSNSIAAFQWAINPDGDPETIDDMPDAITNSWWDPNSQADLCGPDNVYYATLNAVEAAGIAVVFSAGNSGPGSQTITAPKNLNTDEVNIWATGAIDGASYAGGNNNPIASFSSRGPSTCGGEGSLLIKPEASAPGVSVRSSVRGTGYGFMSGTSMAAPHVAGAIALLKEYAPTLTGHEIKMALYNTAKDLGTAGEDNNYGTGLIDLYEAFLALGTPDEVPPTVINDLRVEEAASNSYKLVWTAPLDTSNKGVIAYDIRSSDSPISNDTDFDNADQIPFGTPADAGETEVLLMDGLPFDDTKYYAIKSRDIWDNVSAMSNVVEGTTLSAPSMSVAPQQITHTADEGETFSDAINIENDATAPSTLDYEVSLNNHTFPMGVVRAKLTPKVNSWLNKTSSSKDNTEPIGGQTINGLGGPDGYGYIWKDSEESDGPEYVWNDISDVGVEINFPNGNQDDGHTNYINLGFSFNYYGTTYNNVKISSNGFVSFANIINSYRNNTQIPDNGDPNGIIAVFWDDLLGTDQGSFYYLAEAGKFTVQWEDLQKYYSAAQGGSRGHYTFQLVLEESGRIKIYYKEMDGETNSGTVGIESPSGDMGLQVAYNSSYPPSDGTALQFMEEPEWMEVTDLGGGRLYNGNNADIELDFNTTGLPPGEYSMDITITSNAPEKTEVVVPVTLTVNDPVPVELTSFSADVVGEGEVVLSWVTATETNNKGFEVEKRQNSELRTQKTEEEGWKVIGYVEGGGTKSEESNYRYEDKGMKGGKVSYRLKQIDYDGTYSYSEELEVEIIPVNYKLEQNYPNPFNPRTTIRYALPGRSNVKLSVYNTLGEVVSELVNGIEEAGYYEVEWRAENISSGLYIYVMEAESEGSSFRDVKKMLLLK